MLYANGNPVGGGGGTGGHTIIDENGTSMTARAGLQFVGGANVSDDATNNKTIVDLASAGGIDGVFVDTDNVIVPETSYSGSLSYTATEDCVAFVNILATSSGSGWVYIDNEVVGRTYFVGAAIINGAYYLLKKGQTLTASSQTYSGIDITYAVYGIQTGTTHSKFQPVIYSTEEREVGVWTDGKPLYEKTFYKNNLATTFSDFIKFADMDNPETFVSIRWAAIRDLSTVGGSGILKYTGNGASYTEAQSTNYFILMRGSGNELQYRLGNNYGITEMWATVQYTKTTDTAGSGTWTPQGVPAVHYSTDEQIIGTYFGDTLYQKTIVLTSGVSIADSWTTIYTDALIGNIAQLVDVKYNNVDNKGVYGVLNFKPNGNNLQAVYPIMDGLNVLAGARFTLQYTKSS